MDNYEINSETLLIMPCGHGKSKVFETDSEFIINTNTLNIIKNSCLFFGSSFEGRKEAAKEILSIDMKVPILIEESRNILFFPISNCIRQNSIWVSFKNLLKFSKYDNLSSCLYFKGNKKIIVDIRFNLVDNQYIRCIKYNSLLEMRKNLLKKELLLNNNNYFND